MPARYRACYRTTQGGVAAHASLPMGRARAREQALNWFKHLVPQPLLQEVLLARMEAGEHVTIRGPAHTWDQWLEKVG